MSDKTFIVVYDDEQSLCIPYAWDEDCKGALVAICGKQNAACFNSRKAARKAINISTAFARLKKTQGESVCDDFISEKHNVRVIECRSMEEKWAIERALLELCVGIDIDEICLKKAIAEINGSDGK